MNMENKITVCVADADQAYRTGLCDFLKKQGDICLIGDTADGREALAMVEALFVFRHLIVDYLV